MVWIIIILLTAFDQVFKYLVQARIELFDRIVVIDRFFYLTYRQNTGGAWSFLAHPSWGIYLLTGLSALLTIVLVVLLIRNHSLKLRSCFALIIAGSLGNLIDRVRLGFVVDYLDFHFGTYIFPTFNLADTLIVCGTLLLCFFLIKDQTLIDTIFPGQEMKQDKDPKGINHANRDSDQ